MQPGQGQQVLYIQPIVALPVVRPTSSFALTSTVLGIPAIILAVFNAIFDVRAALMQGMMPTSFAIVLIVALFCWVPALIALIFGLQAKSKIWRSNGQLQGLGLADTSIILGSISLVLSVLGVLFFSLALIP